MVSTAATPLVVDDREVEWSDISRGMKRPELLPTDELQMRVFWRRWRELREGAQLAGTYGDTHDAR